VKSQTLSDVISAAVMSTVKPKMKAGKAVVLSTLSDENAEQT
jgi:hypothetical protein